MRRWTALLAWAIVSVSGCQAKESARNDTAPVPPVADDHTQWRVSVDTNAIDDSPRIASSATSLDGDFAMLVVRCSFGKLEAFVTASAKGLDAIPVRVRWGKEVAVPEFWMASEGAFGFAPDAHSFVRSLQTHGSVTLEVYGETRQTSVFGGEGFDELVDVMRGPCALGP